MSTDSIAERIAHGWNLIESETWKAAIAWGEALVADGEITGYRIKAAAQQMGFEDLDAARATLEGAIRAEPGPESWACHMQLATLLAETEAYEQALSHLQQARALPGAELHWLTFNEAVLLLRQEQWEEGLNLLQQVEHPEVINEAFCLQLEVLDAFGQYDTILDMAETDLDLMQVPQDEADMTTMARICTYIATAAWYEEREEEMIYHYLRQGIEYDRTLEDALWLLRELVGEEIPEARVYAIEIQGRFHDEADNGVPQKPFLCQYGVVAASPEAALTMVQAFEVEAVDKASLTLLSWEEQANEEGLETGIYQVGEFELAEEEEA